MLLSNLVSITGDVNVLLMGEDNKELASFEGGELRRLSSGTVDWISLNGVDISGPGFGGGSLVFTRCLLFLL